MEKKIASAQEANNPPALSDEYEEEYASSPRSVQKNTVVFTPMLILAMALVVVFGPVANLCSKWAFTLSAYTVRPSEVTPDMEPEKFNDNIAQIAFKHITTMIWCVVLYLIDRIILLKKNPEKVIFTDELQIEAHRSLPKKVRMRLILFSAVPAFCDFGFSVFQSAATKMIRTSTVQMIANLNVLMVAFFSMVILKKAITAGQWIAIGVVVFGVVLSGLDGMLFPDVNSQDEDNKGLAVSYVILAALLRSFGTVIEQVMMQGKPIPIFKLYAIEQCFAITYIAIYMVIRALCGNHEFVDTFWQFVNNPEIFWIMTSHGVSACVLNSFGMLTAKLSNPIFRILCMSTRTISSWVIELCIGWNTFEWITLAGQVVLAIGIVLYTGLLYPNDWICTRKPWTVHGRLSPTPDAVLSDRQIAMREARIEKELEANKRTMKDPDSPSTSPPKPRIESILSTAENA